MQRRKVISLVAVILAMVMMLSACGDKSETIKLETGSIESSVSEAGIVVFSDEYAITPIVSARVLTAGFDVGDAVKAGDVLYTLDSVDLSNQIEQTKVSLEQAQESYRQSKNAASDLTLRASANGMITKVYAHKGDYVTPGAKIADIEDSTQLKLTIPFNVSEATPISAGMNATITISTTGATVSGTVKRVYANTQGYGGGRKVQNVEITLQNPGALKKGDVVFASVNGNSSAASSTLENAVEQSIVATQAGEVNTINVSEGMRVSSGASVAVLKNDTVSNSVKTAELNVKNISTSLSQLEAKLKDYTITAPIDGVVIERINKETDIVAPGTPMMKIADKGNLYVETDIDEMYISEVRLGQKAEVVSLNDDTLKYTGTVDRVDESGTEENGVTNYTVRIKIEDTDGLVEGMNVDVNIITGKKDNAKYLPRDAVKGDKVIVKNGRKQEEKTVKTGIKNDEFIEILDGLTEDDEVTVGGKEDE